MMSVAQFIDSITSDLSRGASSAVSAVSGAVPSGWMAGIAVLLLLPVVGVFVRPALRLAGAITHTVSAVVSALLVCVASWIILLISYVTDVTRILSPSAKTRPFIIAIMVSGLVAFAAYALQRSDRGMSSCVVNGVIQRDCLARQNAVRF